MTESGELHPFAQPVRARAAHGGRRGALIGVYIFALLLVMALLRHQRSDRILEQPVTTAAAVIAGSAMAGMLLLIFGPRVRRLASASLLAIVCCLPLVAGIGFATAPLSLKALAVIAAMSSILGVVWGTMAWKRWHR